MFKDKNLGQRCFEYTGKATEIAVRIIVERKG